MTSSQKVVKYIAVAFAIMLIVSIFSGILGAFGTFTGMFNSDDAVREMKTQTYSSDIEELILDVSAAQLIIKNGDEFSISSNNKYILIREFENRLEVTESNHTYTNTNGKIRLEVTIPESADFKSVKITTGAGTVNIESLVAEKLALELGAGQVEIGKLIATESSKISGGTGQINIKDGDLYKLDLEIGVGELRFAGALRGSCDFETGIGASHIDLLGSKDDYRIELEKGLGDTKIDGETISENAIYGNGANKVEIEGGIGEINIDFKDVQE